ncbi:MAG: DHH family phosphoesterase [Saccharofermentans sp.]|nr:DHH family phosphoesterase [Saccharofermentans sp.]
MILDTIAEYNPIYIQMHNNPDADAIGSGYALYRYFKDVLNKNVMLFYGGNIKISKSNLIYMVDMMNIPVMYVENDDLPQLDGDNPILVTVDCQYGARNVEKFHCENIAIIDHHQIEIDNVDTSLILPNYNACSTVVWTLLKRKNYEITDDLHVASALYYGIYMDTNQLSEIHNPVDYDAVEELPYNNALVKFLKNSNISLDEMEIAGNALRNYIYDAEHECAVLKTEKCDPNILGVISDFLLQVDKVNVGVVFCDMGDTNKFSVRSCVKEVDASELASYLATGIGSGGGHIDKAGGYISKKLLEEKFGDMVPEAFFSKRLHEYFDSYDIIYAKDFNARLDAFKLYTKNSMNIGYVEMTDVVPVGTPITCRTIEGDVELTVEEDLIVMIGIKGEVYPTNKAKFIRSNKLISDTYDFNSCVLDATYEPTVHNRVTGKKYELTKFAKTCASTGSVMVYCKPLERGVKIFTTWTKDRYMRGNEGDFLAVRSDDIHDCYVIEKNIFSKTYKEIGE